MINDKELVEKVAKQLYVWHCISQNIPQESFADQNEYIRDYWIDKAKQILYGNNLARLTGNELPENPARAERLLKEKRIHERIEPSMEEVSYWKAQFDMQKAGFTHSVLPLDEVGNERLRAVGFG